MPSADLAVSASVEAFRVTSLPIAEYRDLQVAYAHFNCDLFGNELPDVMIVLTRRAFSRGHWKESSFADRHGGEAKIHELSLNPDQFFGRTDEEILSTLVHEMVHALQTVRGVAPRRAYHNKNFAAEMKLRDLYPSNTGAPGGKEVGAQMSHYIIPGGAFERSYQRLRDTGWKLNLQSAPAAGSDRGKKNKTPFACIHCGATAAGKKNLDIVCGECLVENHPELTEIADAYRMTVSGRPRPAPPPEPEHAVAGAAAE